jgi:hypothetical protein
METDTCVLSSTMTPTPTMTQTTQLPSRCVPGADKSLARPTCLSIVFSVQGTGGSPTGPDPENRVGDQVI